jgi:SAM-dependent methyltransferase
MATRHLDLGCGSIPRNPLGRDQVFGIDIVPGLDSSGQTTVVAANLAVDAIPFEDSWFDSVSAFDFFEHVPRVFPTAAGDSTRFPFIELMNEVCRVLRPKGILYAVTPAYPAAAVFQDPTHVNIITAGTHRYFSGDKPLARMYGFTGDFRVRRAHWAVHKEAIVYTPRPGLLPALRHWNYRRKGALTHFVWDLVCSK